jgi:tetratricopeptide (TPR) repeat protein
MARGGALVMVTLWLPASPVLAQALASPSPSPSPNPSPSPSASALPSVDGLPALLASARHFIDQGSPASALEVLGRAPATDARVRVLKGVAHYHASEPVRAIEQLAAVLDALPPDSAERREAIQVLGLSHYLAGHLGEAIPFLEQTRAFAPDRSELAYVLGMAYIQTRQPDRARETWSRAFNVPADSAAARLLNAQMMVRAEMEEMAQAELTAALQKDPRLPQAHLLLGQAALFRGRLDEAIALFGKELDVDPGNAMAFYRLGDAYTRRLQWDKALDALQRSVWLNPYYSGPYILMGKAYQAKGDRTAAEGMLRRAIAYDPNNKAAHYLLAQVLQQLGRAEEAGKEFDIAQRLQGTTDR